MRHNYVFLHFSKSRGLLGNYETENWKAIMEKFEKRVRDAIKEMKRLGYTPRLLLQMIGESNAVAAVKTLLHKKDPPEGFTRLWEMNRLDLSMENIVCSEDWGDLFTSEEKERAKKRLIDYKFLRENH